MTRSRRHRSTVSTHWRRQEPDVGQSYPARLLLQADMGVDLAGSVTIAISLGYLDLVTLPIGTVLLGTWFATAVIVTAVWSP
jgi:hypothetical protein